MKKAYESLSYALEEEPIYEEHLWIAEILRRQNKHDSAYAILSQYIQTNKKSSFAFTVLSDMFNPQFSNWNKSDFDSSYSYIKKAVECNDNDGNAWMSVWNHAQRVGNDSLERLSLEKLYTIGFFNENILERNRWMLKSVPESSIVITNGDFDTYPALSLQIVESLRTDVVILNHPMLTMEWYAEMAHERAGIPFTLEYEPTPKGSIEFYEDGKPVALGCDSLIFHWLETNDQHTNRPLVFAGTVSSMLYEHLPYTRVNKGAYWYFNYSDNLFRNQNNLEQILFENVSPQKLLGPHCSSSD
ncbi:MAG: tetratricopeptide repeat protein [Chitinispirillaceae bacterium]